LRGTALLKLGYRVLVIVDADLPSTPAVVQAFTAAGGQALTWRAGRALEDELFMSLSDAAIVALVAKASDVVGRELVEQHILSKSNGQRRLQEIEAERLLDGISAASKQLLGSSSRIKGAGWFKSLRVYQDIAKNTIGPNLPTAEQGFRALVEQLRTWMHAG
jgi:hypothetical protein